MRDVNTMNADIEKGQKNNGNTATARTNTESADTGGGAQSIIMPALHACNNVPATAGISAPSDAAERAEARTPTPLARALRILFVALVAAALFAPLTHFALNRVDGVTFPIEIDLVGGTASVDDTNLWTTAEIAADPLGALATGALQDRLEALVENRIQYALEIVAPAHDALLLANASLQRLGIRTANLAAGYVIMPTFYGSGYVYAPDEGLVYQLRTTNNKDSDLAGKLSSYAELVSDYPDVEWYFYLADTYASSDANPAASLISDYVSYEDYYTALAAALPETATTIYAPCATMDDLLATHFRTDHHWTIRGAVEGYNAMADAMEIVRIDNPTFATACANDFYGSAARCGLELNYSDKGVEDIVFDMADITVTINGASVPCEQINRYNGTGGKAYTSSRLAENLYWRCFCGYTGETVLQNPKAPHATLLIVGDSFSDPVRYLFTQSFDKVVVLDPRESEKTVREAVEEYDPDAVLALQTSEYMFSTNCG